MKLTYKLLLSLLLLTSVNAKEVHEYQLNDILDIVVEIQENNQTNNEKFTQIYDWIKYLSDNVKNHTKLDLKDIIRNNQTKMIEKINSNIYSSINYNKPKYIQQNIDPNIEEIFNVKNAFLLMVGNCNISHATRSIIICTDNINIGHSEQNIIIAGGVIDIAHESHGGEGSLIYTKDAVEIAHARSSTILFSKDIDISHSNDMSCINTITFNASHGSCHQIQDNTLTENYKIKKNEKLIRQDYPINQVMETNLKKIYQDPKLLTKTFCQSLVKKDFDMAIALIDPSISYRGPNKVRSFVYDMQEKLSNKYHSKSTEMKLKQMTCMAEWKQKDGNTFYAKFTPMERGMKLKRIEGKWYIVSQL